jgi:hypothetical protein
MTDDDGSGGGDNGSELVEARLTRGKHLSIHSDVEAEDSDLIAIETVQVGGSPRTRFVNISQDYSGSFTDYFHDKIEGDNQDDDGVDDGSECHYCGSEDTIEEAYHMMCESCHDAFLAGQEKGRKVIEELGCVRGREEIEAKIEELEDHIEYYEEKSNLRDLEKSTYGTVDGQIRALDWVRRERDEL